jgi:hypothetical protein
MEKEHNDDDGEESP